MFTLMHTWHWSLQDIEEIYPFELEVYTDLLLQRIREQEKEQTGI
jgi:hypothetical protein